MPYYGQQPHVDSAPAAWTCMDEQTACYLASREPCTHCVCGTLMRQPAGLYNFRLLKVFPLLPHNHDFFFIYRTGKMWHISLCRQEMWPVFC